MRQSTQIRWHGGAAQNFDLSDQVPKLAARTEDATGCRLVKLPTIATSPGILLFANGFWIQYL
jgi:hypothetical protein